MKIGFVNGDTMEVESISASYLGVAPFVKIEVSGMSIYDVWNIFSQRQNISTIRDVDSGEKYTGFTKIVSADVDFLTKNVFITLHKN